MNEGSFIYQGISLFMFLYILWVIFALKSEFKFIDWDGMLSSIVLKDTSEEGMSKVES